MKTGCSEKTDHQAFRTTLGHYASGVTIIATLDDGDPVGFTCQAFQSVSADPPLISFCVMQTSTSYPRIRAAGKFSVNVLSAHQHTLASQFARSGTDKWAGVEWTTTTNGNPIIADTVMWLDCEIQAVHEAGDHYIVIGAVSELCTPTGSEQAPLLYHRGKFCHPQAQEADLTREVR